MTARRERRGAPDAVRATVPFRVMKFSTAAILYDATRKRLTAIRQPNARYGQPWDEEAFRAEARRFVQEFNARSLAAGTSTVVRIVWLVRDRPAGEEAVG
jgi:hypothetical protein